jgi:phenylacetic acid degradation operon negative regulatory protein
MHAVRPKQLVFTLYGDYIRTVGGSIWVRSLIKLLGCLGMSDQSVRSTILRLSRGGWLEAQRLGTKSFYSLTNGGWRLLDEGAARIFERPQPARAWDGKWHLVAYSIPEEQRDKRELLRRELGYLGFGPLTSALWISPNNLLEQVKQLAQDIGVKQYLEVYSACREGLTPQSTLVERCWDLPHINAQYAEFISRYQPLYESHANNGTIEASECFVRRTMLVHEYRRFPYIDPYLPRELLPKDWHGNEAAKLFRDYHLLLAENANAYFALCLTDRTETCDDRAVSRFA